MRRVRMFGAAHLLADHQRALEERPRPRKVSLLQKHGSEVVQARGRIKVLDTECLQADCQRMPNEPFSVRVSRSPAEIPPCPLQKSRPVCGLQSFIKVDVRPSENVRRKTGA